MSEFSTITDAAAGLRDGQVSSVALLERALDTTLRLDGELGVFNHQSPDSARQAAARADAELAAGRDRGPLHGIPFGVKDIISTADAPTTAQSLVLDPAWGEEQGDAPVVTRLRASGAVIVGKTTTSEFAIGLPDPEKPFPIPRNPWDTSTWPGGSSSGTANGVAAGFFLGGLGTDSGGSIRLPAAFNGVTGLKPTYGRVPKAGVVPLGYTFDTVGPIARSARDVASILQSIAGPHVADPTTDLRDVPDFLSALTGDLTGVRIGVDRLTRISQGVADPAIEGLLDAALEVLETLGAQILDVEIPYYAELTTVTYTGFNIEALAYHLPDLRSRWRDYGAPTRATIAATAFATSADYIQIQRVRRVAQKAYASLLDTTDLVVTPTASVTAPTYEELEDPDHIWTKLLAGVHTGVWNATGLPAIALPIGSNANGLPLSLQIAGRAFDDQLVLRAADAFQRSTTWHLASPALNGRVPA